MISSTFTDLEEHRARLKQAIENHNLHASAMENDSAKLIDVLDSSLEMVQDSEAYIGVISHKYGQTPKCPERNPDQLSITELEFNEALRLGRPILLFIMGEKHQGIKKDFEQDPAKQKKLNAFRERAKKSSSASSVDRVYAVFENIADFEVKINRSLLELKEHLYSTFDTVEEETSPKNTNKDLIIPAAPALYAKPDYIGSHQFVGRQAELDSLSDWANRADPTNLLLFEAIGGTGKSILTWEWIKQHATIDRSDWAGCFWYSFYERGAYMQDFCQRALAYMTSHPLKEFKKRKTAEMKDELIAHLHAQPWLLILDGLERVLVAYHRIDAAEVSDEEVDTPTDKMLNRNPCDAIRDEDNDLLRAFAACAPSKILISSRLTPRVLLNQAGQPISGARRITLPGLRPVDAEKLLRSCGEKEEMDPEIRGDSTAIRNYLQENCDNHPLVIGILGGLINNYLPNRGNFDVWVADPRGGAGLDLASLDLTQRRNHILRTAIADLQPASRQLLSTLALLSQSVDFETLKAFNPHRPAEDHEALSKLSETVHDLEQRGLLQYNRRERRYDLHPVVRCVAAAEIEEDDRQRYGQQVVNYFEAQTRVPYYQVQTLDELSAGLNIVRTLIKLGQFEKATNVYRESLSRALLFNLETYNETLTLLRPFFPTGWGRLPQEVSELNATFLANDTAIALQRCGDYQQALIAFEICLQSVLQQGGYEQEIETFLRNISFNLLEQNRLAKAINVCQLAVDFHVVHNSAEDFYRSRFILFELEYIFGNWKSAKEIWWQLDPTGKKGPGVQYRPGKVELEFANWQFRQGTLEEIHLSAAISSAKKSNNRSVIRYVHRLRGDWQLELRNWNQAAESFHEAVCMARARHIQDARSETGLALAKLKLGQLTTEEARSEAERLAQLRYPANYYLALLWLELDESERATDHALTYYHWSWADGEPYVHRYELTKTTTLLQQMDVSIPELLPYDSAQDESFAWEADVRALIEKHLKEKETSKNSASSEDND